MLSSKPCMTTCVIDGATVTLNYYPDMQDLRISDAYGACIYKTRLQATWLTLHAAMRDLARSWDANLEDDESLLFRLRAPSTPAESMALDVTAVAP